MSRRSPTGRQSSGAPGHRGGDRGSLADCAYERLEEMIVTLQLPPGGIVSEGEILRKIGIGRTPTREALQRLAARQLVRAIPRRGVLISDLDIVDHLGLLETRRVLDRLIASRAARRATAAQREALKNAAAAMEKAAERKDLAAFIRADRALDDILDAAARNPSASQAVSPLHTRSRRFWYSHLHDGDLVRAARLHSALVRSVAEANEDAAARASDTLIEYLEQFTRSTIET